MLDLDAIDVEEIATALADQTDDDYRWLINPTTGEVAFWTSDLGIHGETPVDLDELDLIVIDPLPSYIRYQDMVDFAEDIATAPPASASAARWRARAPSGASRTSFTRDTPNRYRRDTPCVMQGHGSAPCSGWRTKG